MITKIKMLPEEKAMKIKYKDFLLLIINLLLLHKITPFQKSSNPKISIKNFMKKETFSSIISITPPMKPLNMMKSPLLSHPL
jgi:hypothetical protein